MSVHQPCTRFPRPGRLLIFFSLCVLLLAASASAAEIVLDASTMGQYAGGISYNSTEPLVLTIVDDATIASTRYAGIESVAPVTIRSPAGKTLSITVSNDSILLYGITAPSVTVESGSLNITVRGNNDGEKGNAFGIGAVAGNVTITGGSVRADIETTGHKNKGIYASHYVIVSGGQVTTDERGGSNTFGLDGGDVETGNADGGILITGGLVTTNSSGGKNRKVGIDSKFGTVRISGNPVVFVAEDGSGARQNYAFNTSILTITGKDAVVFAADGGNYILQSDAALAQNATLIPGKTFAIPAGRTLGIEDHTYLTKPAGTTLLFGGTNGTFTYSRSFAGADGSVVYAGSEPTPQSPFPVAALAAGLTGAVVLMRRRE